MSFKFPFRDLDRRRVICWKAPADTLFGFTSIFLWRLYSPQAHPSQWLNTIGIKELTLLALAQQGTPLIGIYVLGLRIHYLVYIFSKQHCSLRLFLPNPPSVYLPFHRRQTYTAVWSLSPSSPVPILLYPSEIFITVNLLHV